MSFIETVKTEALKNTQEDIDLLTQRQFFHDDENANNPLITNRKRHLDEIYDRAPLYMTRTQYDMNDRRLVTVATSLLQATPNDLSDITIIPHKNSDEVFQKFNYLGVYSDQKDSFMVRGEKTCLYFRLQDDTKRRLVQKYVKTHLNEVAQMVEAENQKIMTEAKSSFEAVCQQQQQPVASNNHESL